MQLKIDPKGTQYEDTNPLKLMIGDMVCLTLGIPVEGHIMSDGTHILNINERALPRRSQQQIVEEIRKLGVKAEIITA